MDLKINDTKLSELGLFVMDWDTTTSNIEHSYSNVEFRNTRMWQGSTYTTRTVDVTARFTTLNVKEYDEKQRAINAIVALDRGMTLRKVYTDFEFTNSNYHNPDDVERSIVPYSPQHLAKITSSGADDEYFYRVVLNSTPSYQQLPMENDLFLYEVTFSFESHDVPFELKPLNTTNKSLGSAITYNGTYPLKMTDLPVRLIVTPSSTVSNPTVTVGNRTWELIGTVQSNQEIEISATQCSVNGIDRTHQTNFADFEFTRGDAVTANFPGTFRILGGYELYL